jgi:hypothetical protein
LQAVEKRPSAALHSSFVTAAYGVRLIPLDFVRLAYGHFSTACTVVAQQRREKRCQEPFLASSSLSWEKGS